MHRAIRKSVLQKLQARRARPKRKRRRNLRRRRAAATRKLSRVFPDTPTQRRAWSKVSRTVSLQHVAADEDGDVQAKTNSRELRSPRMTARSTARAMTSSKYSLSKKRLWRLPFKWPNRARAQPANIANSVDRAISAGTAVNHDANDIRRRLQIC